MAKAELKKEIEQYINNLRVAQESFELNWNIHKIINQYRKEISSINSFVTIVLISTQTTFIMETFKLLDKREDKNIFKLLNICEINYAIFPTEFITEYVDYDGNKNSFTNKIDIKKDILDIRNKLQKHEI